MKVPGEELIIALWKTVAEKGVGGLWKPYQMRREGLATAEIQRRERLLLAQTEREVEEIRSGQKNVSDIRLKIGFADEQRPNLLGKRVEPVIELSAIMEDINHETRCERLSRGINITKALFHAEDDLSQGAESEPDGEVDDDWFARWKEYAGGVSKEQLQLLWGRLLAGELKSPGAFSLRFLDFVRNLSSVEASLIQKLSKFNFEGMIWADSKLLKMDLNFNQLLELEALGVLTGVTGGLSQKLRSGEQNRWVSGIALYNGKGLIIEHDDPQKTTTLRGYKVTALGSQIFGLGDFSNSIDVLREFSSHLGKEGFKVYFATCESVNGNSYYKKGELLV